MPSGRVTVRRLLRTIHMMNRSVAVDRQGEVEREKRRLARMEGKMNTIYQPLAAGEFSAAIAGLSENVLGSRGREHEAAGHL